jgi:transposase
MYPFYLGVDLHLKRTYLVFMDKQGQILDKQRVENDEVETYLKECVPWDTYAVLEATRNWAWMYDLLSEHVRRVELAHPKELRLISRSAVKTDQIDSTVLANLARLNYLPIAYAAPPSVRDLRALMRHREWLVRQRTQAKNRIHAILAGYNLRPPVRDLYGVQGREFISQALEKVRPAAKRVVEDQMGLIDHLDSQVEALETELEQVVALDPVQAETLRLLDTLPGVGRTTALVILAEIGDIGRFNSPKALCNWAGLTPKVHKSDQTVRHGRISKQGSSHLRAAMTRAATVACRSSKRWYLVHENLVPRCGKKGAKVAVARRLLTVAFYMLQRRQPYQENYSSKPPKAR